MKINTIIMLILFLFSTKVFAFDPSGEYTFADTNFTGGMIVKETTGFPKKMAMVLDTKQNMSGHTCDVEGYGERFLEIGDEITNKFTIKAYDEQIITFYITFTPYGAIIKNLDYETERKFCGLNGSFVGKWTKDGVKPSTKKVKSKVATSFCSEYIRIKKDCYNKAKKGGFLDKATSSLRKTSISEEARDDACKDGFSAFGRIGVVKENILNRSLQNDFTQCHEQLSKD